MFSMYVTPRNTRHSLSSLDMAVAATELHRARAAPLCAAPSLAAQFADIEKVQKEGACLVHSTSQSGYACSSFTFV